MSVTQVGAEWTTPPTGASVASLAFPAHAVAAGDDVVIWTSGRAGTVPTALTPSDTGGTGGSNTWGQVGTSITTGQLLLQCWRSTITHGGTLTITITPSNTCSVNGSATEWNGLATSGVDVFQSGTGASGLALDTGTSGASTALGAELIIAAGATGQATGAFNTETFTPAPTTVNSGTTIDSTPGNALQAAWAITGATNTQRYQVTTTVGGIWCVGLATFKPAVAGTKAVPHGYWNRSGIGDLPGTGPNGNPTGTGYRIALCGTVISGSVKGGVTLSQLSPSGRQSADGATTNGTTAVTSASLHFVSGDIGSAISMPHLPSGTTITGVTSVTQCTVSNPATATAGGQLTTIAAPLNGTGAGFSGSNIIEKAITDVRAWNTNSGIWAGLNPGLFQQALKMRVMSGVDSANWMLGLGGGPLSNFQDPVDGGTYNLPYFWTAQYQAAYFTVLQQLGTLYDGVAEIQLVVASSAMTIGNEPCVHQAAQSTAQNNALVAAGYTDAADITQMENDFALIQACFPTTTISFASNPFQTVQPPSNTLVEADDHAIRVAGKAALGSKVSLENNSWRQAYMTGNGPYQQMYADISNLASAAPACPVCFQTATMIKIGDLATALAGAGSLGANSVELADGYDGYFGTASSRTVSDGVTNGTTTVTSATATWVAADVGSVICMADLPYGTTIVSRTSATAVVVSHAATGSHTAQQISVVSSPVAALLALAADLPVFGGGGGSTVPSPPSGVTALQASSTSATVGWTPGGNGGSAITSWTVTPYIGTVAQTAVTGIAAGATSTTITGLTTGFSYTFVVQAVNTNGPSVLTQYPGADASAPITLSAGGATVPSTPVAPGVAGAPSGGCNITVTAPANGGAALDKYIITPYIGTVAQAQQTFIGSPPPTAITLSGLTNGQAYTFTVIAHNAQGNSLESPHSRSFTPAAPPSNSAPTSLIAGSKPFWVLP